MFAVLIVEAAHQMFNLHDVNRQNIAKVVLRMHFNRIPNIIAKSVEGLDSQTNPVALKQPASKLIFYQLNLATRPFIQPPSTFKKAVSSFFFN